MNLTLAQYRSFDRPLRLLMINQFAINVGFYMLMPYLATHLSHDLGFTAATVGLVLGMRNLSQQGMFLVGGTMADRLGYKPMIIAGLVLRTGGFALLGFGASVPSLLVASAATGLAGAFFNPAVRAYVASDAGERRVEAFALFNVFYQAGILVGPLIGLALTSLAFELTCVTAAVVFAGLAVLQLRSLPTRRAPVDESREKTAVLGDWRLVAANKPFLLFSLAMIGSYVLNFQIYLALPLEVRRLAGSALAGTTGATLLFAVSGLLSILGQVRITAWCRRFDRGTCLTAGLGSMAAAFVPPLVLACVIPNNPDVDPGLGYVLVLIPFLMSAALLTLGTVVVYPFEMDTIVALSDNRLVATHYGLYNTLAGLGITLGNLLTGTALDLARRNQLSALPWLALVVTGLLCALAVHRLHRTGRLVAAAVVRP